MSTNRKKKLKKEWLEKTRQKILAAPKPAPAKPILPGGPMDTDKSTQQPLDALGGHEEAPPIEANGVRPTPHTFTPHVREKECLKAFDEGIKRIEEQHDGKFVMEFVLSRRAGRYKPRIRFYLSSEAAKDKPDEVIAALEKPAREQINDLCVALAEKWLGTFRIIMMGAPLESDGSGEGEYCGQVQFIAH